jgi:hypothetical protein
MSRTVCGRCEMDECQCKPTGAVAMTRDDIIRLALDANLLNYVDLETPRRYFIPADAGAEEVEQFAALVVAAIRARN